jgi:hypothetical protein
MGKSIVEIFSNLNCLKKLNEFPLTFTFSAYKNGPPGSGRSEKRTIIREKICTQEFIYEQINNLKPDWELAFNSLFTYNHTRYHIPLIDFLTEEIEDISINRLKEIKDSFGGSILIFKTGRSFHGYHDIVLTEKKWQRYLGALLLLNRHEYDRELTDTRWIGHSLVQGYSSLRISHKTSAYYQIPEYCFKI